MAKFNMLDLLGEQGAAQPPQAKNKAEEKGEGSFPIEYISIHLIDPSEKNFYSTKEIESLADSINTHGLLQNFVIKPMEGGRFRAVAGHRRRLAILLLVERGRKDLEYVPCKVERTVDEIDEELMLITTNKENRKPTGWELVMEAERVRVLLELKRQKQKEAAQAARHRGEEPKEPPAGRIRDEIAKKLNTSSGQIGRLETISRHLIPEFMEELKAERLALNTAYELAGMPEEQQRAMYSQHQEKEGGLAIPDVRTAKAPAAPAPESREHTPPTVIPQDAPAAPPSLPAQPISPPATPDHSRKAAPVPQASQPEQKAERSALHDLVCAAIAHKGIDLVEIEGDSVSVYLPYDTAAYAVDLEGTTDQEQLSSFKAGVNRLLRGMIDHLNDCLLDGEE